MLGDGERWLVPGGAEGQVLPLCLKSLDRLTRGDGGNALVAAQGQQIALVARGDEVGGAGQGGGEHMIVIWIGGHHARH